MTNELDIEFKKNQILQQKCFQKLNPNEVEVLATLLKETTFNAGEVIVKEGDRVDSVFIIIKGEADVIRVDVENDKIIEKKVATLHDGGAIGLSDQGFYSLTGLRTATVIAATDMLTLKLSVSLFRGFALAYPHANEVMRVQAERM